MRTKVIASRASPAPLRRDHGRGQRLEILRNAADLIKSQVKGYTKGDGTYVAPHNTKVHAKLKPGVAAFDHKAPLPAEAFANVGAPTELPPAKSR